MIELTPEQYEKQIKLNFAVVFFIFCTMFFAGIFTIIKQNQVMKLADQLSTITQQALADKNDSSKLRNAINVMKNEAKYGHTSATFYGPNALSKEDITQLQKEGLTVEENKTAQIVVVKWPGVDEPKKKKGK